jgi:hypothetical protein
MNSPDERPTPAATTPGPTMRQSCRGDSGSSRTWRSAVKTEVEGDVLVMIDVESMIREKGKGKREKRKRGR